MWLTTSLSFTRRMFAGNMFIALPMENLRPTDQPPSRTHKMAAELHVLHANVNGLRVRKSELELYLSETKPQVVVLNETKLCGKHVPRFADYRTAALRDRSGEKPMGGGVAVLLSNNVTFSDISPDVDDIAAVEIRAGVYKIAVVSYYCPPDDSDLKTDVLEQLTAQYEAIIIAGDLNAKHQYYGSSRTNTRGEYLFDFIERADLIVANNADEMTSRVVGPTGSD